MQSCSEPSATPTLAYSKKDTVLVSPGKQQILVDTVDYETATKAFYLVEIAEGYDFDSLNTIAQETALFLGSKVNMLGRLYKSGKGIVVPEDSEDEMYRGAYYPRRPFDEQNFVSVEMKHAYEEDYSDTMKMIVFSNIFDSKKSADSMCTLLKSKFATTQVIKRDLFLGCMH